MCIYCETVTTIRLVNASIYHFTNIQFFFFLVRAFKFYSLSNFQICRAVLLVQLQSPCCMLDPQNLLFFLLELIELVLTFGLLTPRHVSFQLCQTKHQLLITCKVSLFYGFGGIKRSHTQSCFWKGSVFFQKIRGLMKGSVSSDGSPRLQIYLYIDIKMYLLETMD